MSVSVYYCYTVSPTIGTLSSMKTPVLSLDNDDEDTFMYHIPHAMRLRHSKFSLDLFAFTKERY